MTKPEAYGPIEFAAAVDGCLVLPSDAGWCAELSDAHHLGGHLDRHGAKSTTVGAGQIAFRSAKWRVWKVIQGKYLWFFEKPHEYELEIS